MATNYLSHYAADNFRLVRSKELVTPADATYNVFVVPKKAFVLNVWIRIDTAWDVAAELTVGFSGNGETANAAYFMDTSLTEPIETGMKSADMAKYFSAASGFITLTTLKVGTAGHVQAFMAYSIIH